MTETQFFYWLQWLDEKGRMWVHDPREIGRVGSAPAEARRLHNAACRFGWVKEDMVEPSVSDLFVRAQGKQVSVQNGADFMVHDAASLANENSPGREYWRTKARQHLGQNFAARHALQEFGSP